MSIGKALKYAKENVIKTRFLFNPYNKYSVPNKKRGIAQLRGTSQFRPKETRDRCRQRAQERGRVGSFICQFHEVESIHGIEDNCETNSSPLSEA